MAQTACKPVSDRLRPPRKGLVIPGAVFRFATDIEDYANWTLAHILREPRFHFAPPAPGSWHEPYPGWRPTRYEEKARLEGRNISFYFEFTRQ